MTNTQREQLKNQLVVKKLEQAITEKTAQYHTYPDSVREFCIKTLAWADGRVDAMADVDGHKSDDDMKKALQYFRETCGCPACQSTNLDGGWLTKDGRKYQKKKMQRLRHGVGRTICVRPNSTMQHFFTVLNWGAI